MIIDGDEEAFEKYHTAMGTARERKRNEVLAHGDFMAMARRYSTGVSDFSAYGAYMARCLI